jgi:membrane-associated phospholipid phosphatase
LLRLGAGFGTGALILAALVFWSRLFLGRHTMVEAVVGACLGIAGGVVTAWL